MPRFTVNAERGDRLIVPVTGPITFGAAPPNLPPPLLAARVLLSAWSDKASDLASLATVATARGAVIRAEKALASAEARVAAAPYGEPRKTADYERRECELSLKRAKDAVARAEASLPGKLQADLDTKAAEAHASLTELLAMVSVVCRGMRELGEAAETHGAELPPLVADAQLIASSVEHLAKTVGL